MAEIAVAVRDPGGHRFAQSLHEDLPVRELTLILADRLDLPKKLNYQLINLANGKALDAGKTLQAAKISAGAELQLKPIRDKAFDTLVKVLKDQAEGELKDEARKEAKETLGRLLAEQSAAGGSSAASQPAPEPRGAETSGQKVEPAKASSSCSRVGCALVLLAALAAVAVGVVYYDDYIKPILGRVIPGIVSTEPQLGTGDVQVTLRWETPVDLDLHVIDPSGEEIWFQNSNSASGGTLDVDANASCNNEAPVENIYWPTGGAPFGTYQVYVVYYQSCGYTGLNAYTVTILVDGQSMGPYQAVLPNVGEEQVITSFSR